MPINWITFPSSFRIMRIKHSYFYYYSKDARLPVQLQRAMAAEAEAAREARAKVYKNTNCSISITYINNIISYYIELLVSLVIIHVGDCSRG